MTEPIDMASTYRQIYRNRFKEGFLAGERTPFLFHICFLGSHVIPVLYLSIPHKRRPWLYRARWLVLTVTVALQIWIIRRVSSPDFAFAYGAGLLSAWGIIWNFTLLVWTRPQWDAKRVERVRNPRFKKTPDSDEGFTPSAASEEMNGHITGTIPAEKSSSDVPSDIERNGYSNRGPPTRKARPTSTSFPESKGHAANGHKTEGLRNRMAISDESSTNGSTENEKEFKQLSPNTIARVTGRAERDIKNKHEVDLFELGDTQEFIYEWQEFPENGTFTTRLDWTFDIATTLRMTGWNWALSVLPPYRPPPWQDGYQLPLHVLGDRSSQGYTRVRTRRELIWQRLIVDIIPSYIILDICATFMMQDPYFIVGPNDLPLPPSLACLHPAVLSLRRSMFCFSGILSALRLAWSLGAIAVAFLGPPVLGFRADLWHLPSLGGSFDQVLDRGMTGFWGSWWHQTFRFGFSAPTKWMINNGYIVKGSVWGSIVGALVAFLQSGFLHAMGSYTSIPETRPWEPPIFFLLAAVGTLLQNTLSQALESPIRRIPRWARRAGNLLFVAVWLHMTSRFLFDDFGRNGVWLWEPVPFSFVRWLGFGTPGDYWWRYDRHMLPRWYNGRHWWDTGIGI